MGPAPLLPGDLRVCQRMLRAGSKSFALATLLLPRAVRDATTVTYAYCRLADDWIDEALDPLAALGELHRRTDAIFAGRPEAHPVDRAFAAVVAQYELPRAPVDWLLEGFAWDAEGRGYEDIEALEAYCARVASTVGVMMSVLLGVRDEARLSRATDLGIAMQLTNIARDVGEDARRGRLYLPRRWLEEAGIDIEEWMACPQASPRLAPVVLRLLTRADVYYRRADLGIAALPRRARVAIFAARLIYADIGQVIRRVEGDSVTRRAVTSRRRKAWLVLRALGAWLWRTRRTHPSPVCAATALVAKSCRDSAAPPRGLGRIVA